MTDFRGDSIRVVHPLFQGEGGGSTPTSPLQLHVGKVSVDLAIDLNKLWHSRLPKVDKSNIVRNKNHVCFGAEYGNVWYAAAIWSSPVARLLDDERYLELRRFAIAPDAPKNSASRMLRIMTATIRRELPAIAILCSYQDSEVHAGTIYAAAGWARVGWRRGGAEIWTNNVRKRATTQASGDKIRWELPIRTSQQA